MPELRPITIPLRSVMKQITLHVEVTGTTEAYTIRRWLAMRLIQCAAWLLGCNVQVNFPQARVK